MKQIFPEILRPEENAGFTPGEPDDDTFLLETQKSYPGTIPSFDDENDNANAAELTEISSSSSPQEEILEPPAGGSVWDVFEQDPIPEQTAAENTQNENIEETISEVSPESQYHSQETEEQQTENEYLFADEIEIADEPSEEADQSSEPIVQLEEESEIPDNISSIELDSSFIAELEKEIEKNKVKKEIVENLEEEYPEETPNKPFESEDNPSLFLILSDINTETSSNLSSSEISSPEDKSYNAEIETEPLVEELNGSDKKKKKEKKKKSIDEEKRIKFTSLLKYPAVFLLFAVSGIALYYIWDNFGYDKLSLISGKLFGEKSDKELVKQVKDTKEKDVVRTGEPVLEKEEVQPDIQEQATTDIVAEKVKQETKTEQVVQEESKSIQKPEKLEKPKPDFARNERREEIKPPPKKAPDRQIPKNNVTRDGDISLNNKKVAKEEIYTIQIYSTPSLEDAQNWVRELKMRHNIDAYISPQVIRDRQWYRVRFGYFSSMEEATATAMKFGFTQSWIDRIR
ncbi:MAG TPA: SPOR domain-containing protein [Candidatus Kapabacteria bacterium]|nr:SPOR domain-containing protein [Candidatus Kapabacteria bacterium]HOM05127.1 SPOR domain-containing protein [Candidatus Kapabacteria bacterium]HPP39593.1 SPOR domain-containing protein [Candidatus Kapabacteria bacterium]